MSRRPRQAEIAAQLLDLAPQVRGMVTRFMQQRAGELNLTMLEFDVLRSIEPGSPWMKELANRMVISRPAVTKLVEGLVGKGFVERRESTRDRRAKNLRLTPQGRAALRRARREIARVLGAYVDQLSDPARADLHRGLAELLDAFASGRNEVAAATRAAR